MYTCSYDMCVSGIEVGRHAVHMPTAGLYTMECVPREGRGRGGRGGRGGVEQLRERVSRGITANVPDSQSCIHNTW